MIHPSSFHPTIPDFKELIAKMQAQILQTERPQRRVFSSNPQSKIENPKSQDDFDPIYTYDLNGNRISMIDPTGIATHTYDALNRLTSITNNRGFTLWLAHFHAKTAH